MNHEAAKTCDGDRAHETPRAHWWILAVIAGAQLMVVLDTTIMLIALPSAQRSLGFPVVDRQWVITAYTLTFGGLLLLGGRISDMIGPKRTLLTGVAGFAVASAAGGASQSIGMLIATRALQGLFGALLAPSVLSLLTTTFTEARERGRAFGIWAAIATGGAALGIILGGILTQYLSWRWCLYVNVPIAAAAATGAILAIPSRPGHSGVRPGLSGALLGSGGLVALVYALGQAGADGWASPRVLGPLVGALVLLGAFVVNQSKAANPLLPPRVVASRNRGGAFTVILLAMLANYGAFLFLTYILQAIDHYSPLKAGLAFLPLTLINGLVSTQVSGRLLPHLPPRLLIVPGLLAAALGALVLTRLTPSAGYLSHVLPAELLLGLGLGLAVMPLYSTATQDADPRDAGVTGAAANTSQQIGASIGTAVLNTIAATATASYLMAHAGTVNAAADAAVHGYAVASACAAGVLMLAALLGGILINAHPSRARSGAQASPQPNKSPASASTSKPVRKN